MSAPRALLLALAGLWSCGCRSLECTPISAAVTGDPAKDIIATWGGFGVDSPVVFDFRPGGSLHIVEEPNRYAPSGNVSDTTYTVDAVAGTYTQAGGQPVSFQIKESEMTETRAGGTRAHARLRCTGFGFDR